MSETPPASEITQYPLLPLRDVVVFPHMVIPLFVGRPKSIKAMETAMEAGKSILLDTMYELPTLENVSKVVVDESMVSADGKPLLIYSDSQKVAGGTG